MFRHTGLAVPSLSIELNDLLKQTLSTYHALTNGDPKNMRRHIMPNDIWRLFVDKDVWDKEDGWWDFEFREPGYLRAMYTAFQEIHDPTIPLTPEYIERLHFLATNNVKNTHYDGETKFEDKIGQFRGCDNHNGGFYLCKSNCSPEGIEEFLQRGHDYHAISINLNVSAYSSVFTNLILKNTFLEHVRSLASPSFERIKFFDIVDFMHPKVMLRFNKHDKYFDPLFDFLTELSRTQSKKEYAQCVYNHMSELKFLLISSQHKNTRQVLTEQIKKFIEIYNKNILQASTEIEKIMVIIDLVQSCEQLHPFQDANCRTFCMLFFNHLLLRNGLPFAILENPNEFDLYSRKELLERVIKGMAFTLNLIKNNECYQAKTNLYLFCAVGSQRKYLDSVFNIEINGRENISSNKNSP